MQTPSLTPDPGRLEQYLTGQLESCSPRESAGRIVCFCLGELKATGVFELSPQASEVRIRAATQVVSTLPYRNRSEFKEAALAAVLERVPQIVADKLVAQNLANTIAVFGALGAGEASVALERRLAKTITEALISDRVTPVGEKMKPGLELLVGPRFGEDFPWEQKIAAFVDRAHTFLQRERNPEEMRFWLPSLLSDRRAITSLGAKSAELVDDLVAQYLRTWQPTTGEAVYNILLIEGLLVRDSVLTPRSEATRSLCSAFEAALLRWRDEAGRSPDAAASLALEVIPLCAHFSIILSVFPEIASPQAWALVRDNIGHLNGLAHKGFEGGADLSDVTLLLWGGDTSGPELLEGFKKFLADSPPNQVLLGVGQWWALLKKIYDPDYGTGTGIVSFKQALEQFLSRCEEELVTASNAAVDILHQNSSAPDEVNQDELRRRLQTYGALYNLLCRGRAELLGKEISEVIFSRPNIPGTDVESAAEELKVNADDEPDDVQKNILLAIDLEPRAQYSALALVRNALHAALSDLRTIAAWAATQICYPDIDVFLPPEAPYGRNLVEFLDYDSSSDPVEVRWAYGMQILRLLACPEVHRLAQYGGAPRTQVVMAMREVLARERGFDYRPDGLINLES